MSDKKIDPVLAARSEVGNATRSGDPARLARAYQQMASARIERTILADRDALNDDDRTRLVALLAGGGN